MFPNMAEESEKGSETSSQECENILALTEQQENFKAECEELFANRYTEEDPDYKNILENGIGDPPIVDPWYHKPRRNFVWSGRRDDRRYDSHRSDHRDDRRDQRDRPRHFDGDSNRRDRYRNDRSRDSYHNRDSGRYRNSYQGYRRDSRHSY